MIKYLLQKIKICHAVVINVVKTKSNGKFEMATKVIVKLTTEGKGGNQV